MATSALQYSRSPAYGTSNHTHDNNNNPCCPSCGSHLHNLPSMEQSQADLIQAQSRIADLELQVRQLNEKANGAVERWAEYEEEVFKLKTQISRQQQQQQGDGEMPTTPVGTTATPSLPAAGSVATPSTTRTSILQASTNRISALLSPRKSAQNLRSSESSLPTGSRPSTASGVPASPSEPSALSRSMLPPPPPPPASEKPSTPLSPPGRGDTPAPVAAAAAETQDLIKQLTREKSLRKEAEGRLTATSKEVEELSAALFEQANEMVADERRARAKLEERVGELERRDAEKRRRLETLEGAMGRIERVRTLLAGTADED